ncbi:MAG: hypothetical protein K0R33_988, partial [Mycobacterium sp.]|nr:hypothetical protein [Mycobacterium sp.]
MTAADVDVKDNKVSLPTLTAMV